MQLHREITLTPENDEYVTALWRISGVGTNDILNAALDMKREQDAALIGDINALIARVQKSLNKEETENKEAAEPETVRVPCAAETPEKPKRRGGPSPEDCGAVRERDPRGGRTARRRFFRLFRR